MIFPSQGIRAMDDSIQTLKDEMNKLMSVYEYVKVLILCAWLVSASSFLIIQPAREARGPEGPARWER